METWVCLKLNSLLLKLHWKFIGNHWLLTENQTNSLQLHYTLFCAIKKLNFNEKLRYRYVRMVCLSTFSIFHSRAIKVINSTTIFGDLIPLFPLRLWIFELLIFIFSCLSLLLTHLESIIKSDFAHSEHFILQCFNRFTFWKVYLAEHKKQPR